MKISVGFYSALIVALTACGSENSVSPTGGETSKENVGVASNAPAAPASMAADAISPEKAMGLELNPEHGKPGHRCEIPVGAPLNSTSQPDLAAPVSAPTPSNNTSSAIPLNLKGLASIGQAGGSAVNPEHGKPGHRCDVAVGAPLNGGATAAAQPVAVPVSQPQVTIPTAASAPVATPVNAGGKTSAAGLNPEHGKPGHRCDIAVGAPLNSKPGQAQPQVVSTPAPVTPVKKGMNPQHGQPGHRCDIAVGAPLDSKPTTATPVKPADAKAGTDTSGK